MFIVSQCSLQEAPQNPFGNLDGGKMQEMLYGGGSRDMAPRRTHPDCWEGGHKRVGMEKYCCHPASP